MRLPSSSTLLHALPPSLPLLLMHTFLTLPFLLFCVAGLLSLRPSHARRNLGLSCLYVGRVWHVRFLPTIHKFGYGLFYTYLDLDHLPQTFSGLWPLASFSTLAAPSLLPALAHFHEADHLKDIPIQYASSSLPSNSSSSPPKEGGKEGGQQRPLVPLPLVERVRRLVEKETGKRPKGKICLLTHLRYMGYTFNPVSFYYVWDEEGQHLETVVAEVSNTPWNEMHCYVLSPHAANVSAVKKWRKRQKMKDGGEDDEGGKEEEVWNYVFEKTFHVSPFMDMAHIYDWEFVGPREGGRKKGREGGAGTGMWVTTHMLKKESRERYFTAHFSMDHRPFSLLSFAWCVLRFPLITWAVQFLIHFQAFKLWAKKVPFYDHPEGTQTWASAAVGTLMAPLWKLQARQQQQQQQQQQKKTE
ncbi:chromosome partitioning protein [Nannochloropsis oceanica]